MSVEILKFFLDRIAAQLGLESAPIYLTRGQIARIAQFKNSHSLASAFSRGLAKRQPRWLAFEAAIGNGAHRVAAERVAHWMAIQAGMLPMPAMAKKDDGEPTLESAFGLIRRRGG
ncbi:conserved hypothetical protein [Thiomonas arsenitoxydans]|uniref:Uncharacterized protein n=1 Tax=Thiomonas arsenitoxydans (strain DSM 22701 / CIP 110005 / 3As) TaxID=426114 RepID=D6CTM6_THIA3|nr:hypothetical protein [Thiomonas arsenitoxydans]CQR44485.1 conserved hypothetical protein [Thiomonas sp. CB3]CAZ88645.1 hypothetical protein THI_1982 [Thiomonas arsenitoxydans]CQR27766.1 conserved hypothetical protein [Thiomonas arsenitoxydans]CQR32007.1 conserved hypothetical protein [Thiomonas arsenitoxydans]CQR34729.1 conserved hypothetical protein [Thiomonas arsenitoxydans]